LASSSGGRLDVEAWAKVPAGIPLHDGPDIRTFPAFLNDEVCAWLIERSRGLLVRARVYDAGRRTDVVSEKRTNTAAGFNLVQTDLVHLMVQTRIAIAGRLPFTH